MLPRQYRGRYVRRWHYGTKTNRVVATDRMLDSSFVTKASSLKPRPSILYLEAQMYGRNVSWVDKVTTYSFLSPKLTMCWGLPTHRVGKAIYFAVCKG